MELDNQMDPGWNEYRLRSLVGHLITPSLSFPIYEMRVDMRNAFFLGGGVKLVVSKYGLICSQCGLVSNIVQAPLMDSVATTPLGVPQDQRRDLVLCPNAFEDFVA